jgi:HSP20 family molecular chaperone IbpA
MERRFANQVSNNYPPHNIIKTGENTYEIEVAVTGFEKIRNCCDCGKQRVSVRGESQTEEDLTSSISTPRASIT